jgi:cytochrome o ubiquinol oxidase subunit 3
MCLLLSSFHCGMCSLAIERRDATRRSYFGQPVTIRPRLAFLGLEAVGVQPYDRPKAPVPTRSAFLLGVLHAGRHARACTSPSGLLWFRIDDGAGCDPGLPADRRCAGLLCLTLFWHALDIVWIGVFTIVYLGAH